MTRAFSGVLRSVGAIALSRRMPSRRSLAALAKLCGRRLERRWPFLPKAEAKDLNLGFDDLLALQYSRSRNFVALVVGAFDGVTNDPASEFLLSKSCQAIFVEPQPGPFGRMQARMGGNENIVLLNAAIDRISGVRTIYCIPPGIDGLPAWTEQLASFRKEHLLNHEARAPGLSRHIVELSVPTLSFDELLDRFGLKSLDVLQIDAEGMDAELLGWFPFERIKPGLLHYETAHMTAGQNASIRKRLQDLGYVVRTSDSPTDDMAILF